MNAVESSHFAFEQWLGTWNCTATLSEGYWLSSHCHKSTWDFKVLDQLSCAFPITLLRFPHTTLFSISNYSSPLPSHYSLLHPHLPFPRKLYNDSSQPHHAGSSKCVSSIIMPIHQHQSPIPKTKHPKPTQIYIQRKSDLTSRQKECIHK
jgi:hypothetical protein